jgi:hypothetical protein
MVKTDTICRVPTRMSSNLLLVYEFISKLVIKIA